METKEIKEKIHKSKTQLSIIYGYIQLLEKELASKDKDSKELKWVIKTLEACKQLETLLQSIDE